MNLCSQFGGNLVIISPGLPLDRMDVQGFLEALSGKRNAHGIHPVRIKVMGKEGLKEIQQWVRRQ